MGRRASAAAVGPARSAETSSAVVRIARAQVGPVSEADDDDPLDALLLELLVEVRIGEAAAAVTAATVATTAAMGDRGAETQDRDGGQNGGGPHDPAAIVIDRFGG